MAAAPPSPPRSATSARRATTSTWNTSSSQDVSVPGTAGQSLFELLEAKLRDGVAVTLIHDGFGSAATPAAAFERLRAAGARTLAFNPLNPAEARAGWAPNDRDHRKIMVVDGRIGMTGGVNLDRVYENSCEVAAAAEQDPAEACWRDAALRIEGPAVAGLQKLFLETWEKQRGPPLPPRDWFPRLSRAARRASASSAACRGSSGRASTSRC